MNLYACSVNVFNGRYTQKSLQRIQASSWSAAATKAVRAVLAERQKRGLGRKHLERIDLQLVRIPKRIVSGKLEPER